MRHVCCLLVLLLGAATTAVPQEPPLTLAELAGERLRFKVSWTAIPAANAEFSVTALGDDTYRLAVTAESYGAANLVYPLESKLVSTVSGPGIRVLGYERSGREGWGDSMERMLTFDHEKGEVRYTRNGELRKVLPVPPDVQDPLSCVYYYRLLPVLPESGPVRFTVTDGKTVLPGEINLLAHETVETPAGTFRTIKVEPKMEGVRGVFRKSPDAHFYIWLTDDRLRRPVKVETKVAVGSFHAVLVAADPPMVPLPGPLPATASPPAPAPSD